MLCNDLDRAVWSQGNGGRPGDENAEFLAVMFEGFFGGPGVTDPSVGEPNDAQLLAGLALWRLPGRVGLGRGRSLRPLPLREAGLSG